eukprot:5080586-Pyramimonas_sp.AAC.1
MRWLDPRGQLQEAVLAADRQAVESGARLRNARAQDRPSGHGGGAAGRQRPTSPAPGRARSTTIPWHENTRQQLGGHTSDSGSGAAQVFSRGGTLDALIRTLDATQRDDEAAGRTRQQNVDRTSLNGSEAQTVAEGLLRETRTRLDPASWISRA